VGEYASASTVPWVSAGLAVSGRSDVLDGHLYIGEVTFLRGLLHDGRDLVEGERAGRLVLRLDVEQAQDAVED
jgi:hypothetical protein